MAIDFPASPNTNDTYTANNRTWLYDGAKWKLVIINAPTNQISGSNLYLNANYI